VIRKAVLLLLPLTLAGGALALQAQRPAPSSVPAPAQTVVAKKAPAVSEGLIVVELFTSQGCSSCPPANEAVARLADTRPDVLALTYGVEVWDHLGWADTNARSPFSQRQVDYNVKLGKTGVYTPQVVVGGEADLPGTRPGQIQSLIAKAGPVPATPAVTLGAEAVTVGPGPAANAQVLLVRYDPKAQQVPIRRGENGGRTLLHKNVVRELVVVGEWRGASARYTLPAAKAAGLRTVILIQDRQSGRLLGAAKA
jgi:hypothetical protein